MTKFAFVFAVIAGLGPLVSAEAADRDLGAILPVQMPDGKPAFGAKYTYGKDPDGPSYLFTYSAKVAAADAARKFRWNFYLRSKDKFVLDWSADRRISPSVFQIKVSGKMRGGDQAVDAILIGQKKVDGKNELSFVLANDKDEPQYAIAISDLCTAYPDKFADLSEGKKCDEIQP